MQPGWPVVLSDGPVRLRPYKRGDAKAWSESRRANESWLAQWEPTPYGTWRELNSPAAFRSVYADLRRAARHGTAMPFAVGRSDVHSYLKSNRPVRPVLSTTNRFTFPVT